jgi:hypothetical protein
MAAMVALGAACRPGRSGPGPEARFEHQARPGNPRKDDPHILRANGAKPTWHDLGLSFRDRLRPAVACRREQTRALAKMGLEQAAGT